MDNLGQPLGDVVEAAGVDGNLVARAVELHPGAVQFRLENRCATEAFEYVDGRTIRLTTESEDAKSTSRSVIVYRRVSP